jgi:hypothetical protein
VIESGERPRLAGQPLEMQRHPAVQARVVGEVDLPPCLKLGSLSDR